VQMGSDGLWAKVLQTNHNSYVPTPDSFGDIATVAINDEAKLSDAAINAIAPGMKVYKFATMQASSTELYVKTNVNFEDRARAFGISSSTFWMRKSTSYSDSGWKEYPAGSKVDSYNYDNVDDCKRIMVDRDGDVSNVGQWTCRTGSGTTSYSSAARCFSHGYGCLSGSGQRVGMAYDSQVYVKLDSDRAWA